MARAPFDMQELKANGFKTNDRRYLDKAHEIATGFKPEPHETDDQVRESILTVYPECRDASPMKLEPKSNVTSIDEAVVPELRKMPNLSGNGKWEGRMRRVKYTRQTASKYEDALPVRWEEAFVKLKHNEVTDIPYPFYHNLMSAINITLTTEIVADKTPGVPRGTKVVEILETHEPKYNITDLGDVPGTEHLPENYGDFFRQVARKTTMLKGVSRAWLLKIHTILFGVTPITELVHVSDQDIRLKIATRLGPEFEQLMADELYGTAVA